MKKSKGSRLNAKRAGKAICALLLIALLVVGMFPRGALAQEESIATAEVVDAYTEEAIGDPEGDLAADGSEVSQSDPSAELSIAPETGSTHDLEAVESQSQETSDPASSETTEDVQVSEEEESDTNADSSVQDQDSVQDQEDSIQETSEASEETSADSLALMQEQERNEALKAMKTQELVEALKKLSSEQVQSFFDSLDDDEYDEFLESLSDEELMELQKLFGDTDTMLMAVKNEYVGFAKTKYGSTTEMEFAESKTSGGHGVHKYYLAAKQVFDYYIDKNNTWSAGFSQNDLIAASQVAYCFNYHKTYPTPAYNTTNALYDETQHSTADFFYNATSGYVRTTNRTELYNRVLGVALNGYPNNSTNIQYTYGLEADEFRYLTQYAIWYWTDSIDLEFNTTYKAYRVVDRTTGQVLAPTNGNWFPDYADHRYEYAYKDLINSYASTGSASYINLYRNQQGQSFQNLLAVGQEDPPQSTTGLKITKTVTGEGGEKDRYFNFTITVLNNVRRPISGTYTVTSSAISGVGAPTYRSLTFDQDGQATVQLKHGQSIQIDGLPLGFFYTVRELEADTEQKNYRTTVSNSQDSENDSIENSNMHKAEGAKSLQSLTFTNHRIKEIPDNKVSVSIEAKKTVDGAAPGEGNIFSFQLKNQNGELLQTVQNDADGKIRFAPLTFDRAGTYTYTIQEVNDRKSGIIYDTTPRTVTVTISGDDFGLTAGLTYYATGENNNTSATNRFMMTDETTGESFQVFCLNHDAEAPNSQTTEIFRYNRQRIPSLADLENYVDRNLYGEYLIDVLKKVTYYNEHLSVSETEMDKKQLIWCASGNTKYTSLQSKVDEIIRTVQVPDNYNLELYIPENGNNQAFIRGTVLNTTVTQNQVVFNNTTGNTREESGSVAVISAKKLLDGALVTTPGRFTFILRDSSGQELKRETNGADGMVHFTMNYTTAGTYEYTIEELDDNQPGIEYDTEKKTVTVVVTSQALQTYDESKVYYGWNRDDTGLDEDYVVDVVKGGSGIKIYCSNQNKIGPKPKTVRPIASQTYQAKINPDVITTGDKGMVAANLYKDQLEENLKKLLCYLESDDAKQFDINEKQKLVWSATGEASKWGYKTTTINGQKVQVNNDIYNVLNKIYETTPLPENYNLVFFIPTNDQANVCPQPMIAGYGSVVKTSVNDVTFENTTIPELPENSLTITKTVTGGGDKNQLFTFTIMLYDQNGALQRGKFAVESFGIENVPAPSYTELDFSRGMATVQLKHGQSIKINGLPGEGYYYSVSETEANKNGYTTTNPQAPASERFNVVTESKIVEFVNHKDAEYSLKVTKNNENKELLEGAGFRLFTDEECTEEATVFVTQDKSVSQKMASMSQLMTNKDGVMYFYGLKTGTYYLKEVRTPSGYSLLEDPVRIEIKEDGSVTVNGVDKTPEGSDATEITVTVTDTSVQLSIPQSGASGILPFIAAALFLMLIAFTGSMILNHKQRWSCKKQGSHKE